MIGSDGKEMKVLYTQATYNALYKEYNSLLESNGTEDELEVILAKYGSIQTFVPNYLRAKFAYTRGKTRKAANYMDLVIQEILDIPLTDDGFCYLNCISFKDIYGNAGEIYANNDEQEKAVRCYQNYELAMSRIASCDYSEGLLSFRPFNEYSLSDLVNNEITVCSPRVMNDPYDTLLIKWGECFKNNKEERKHIAALCQSFESYRIRSFSRLKDKQKKDTIKNVLMWSHYADSHKGFCVKYKFSDNFIKTEERFVSRIKEIIYHDRNVPFDLNVNSMSTNQALCTKLNDWEYENEVRLITYAPDANKNFLKLPLV